jgi:hypothetical protein
MSASIGFADLQLANLRLERLRCRSSLVAGVLTLRFNGSGEASDQSLLHRLLESAHAVAIDHRVAKVVIDLERVNDINPSCFSAFHGWVSRVSAMTPGQRYAVHFRLNRGNPSQRTSVNALQSPRLRAISFD